MWESCLSRLTHACDKLRGRELARDDWREHSNDARAYHHILIQIAVRYGWPPGWDAGKLRALIPETITL